MKIGDVLSFSEVYSAIKDKSIPVKIAYKFVTIAHKFEEETKFYHNELQKIVDLYVEKQEDGTPVFTEDRSSMKIISGKEEECAKAMDELQSLEVDVEPCFTLEELDSLVLTPTQMQALYPFIKE